MNRARTAACARTGARWAWTGVRAWRNLPVTVLAVAWARANGASPTLGPDLFVECAGMRPGSFARGGTTVGNAWLHGGLGGPRRRRHELRHADSTPCWAPRRSWRSTASTRW